MVEINGQHFRISLGEDGKRVLAFYPQSIAAGILKEAMLRLFARPGEQQLHRGCTTGKTPLRAPIHDSLLLEIPVRVWDRVVEIVCMEMQRPVLRAAAAGELGAAGEFVAIGVAAKAGQNWGAMEKIAVPGYERDWVAEPMEDEDGEDWSDSAAGDRLSICFQSWARPSVPGVNASGSSRPAARRPGPARSATACSTLRPAYRSTLPTRHRRCSRATSRCAPTAAWGWC
mgnify:CR=1 FL=1